MKIEPVVISPGYGELISEIKQIFGQNCLKKSTYDFKRKNLIIFQDGENEVILDYHFSDEIGFFGTDVNFIDYVVTYIEDNSSRKIYYFLLLKLKNSEEDEVYFAIPMYFIKNNKQEISKSEYKGSIPPQYKFKIIFKNGKYWLRLKNNQLEDISIFQTSIKGLLNQSLINYYEEEKEKYFNTKKDKEGLLRKLAK